MNTDFDWTTDPTTQIVNSSMKFCQIVTDVKDLLTLQFSELGDEDLRRHAILIVAQLAHVNGLAPVPTSTWEDWIIDSPQVFNSIYREVRAYIYNNAQAKPLELQNSFCSLVVAQIVRTHHLSLPVAKIDKN